MAQKQKQSRNLTEKEKKKIKEKMVKGYKKMAIINRELAEDKITRDDETR